MTQLSALPVLSVQIAFTPTNIQSPTQTWTDVTPYVREFQTKAGKQHYLDRVQSSTVNLTVNNRTGFFLNGTTNGTGAIIAVRLPIKITATYGATTYPVFYGLIDSIEEKIGDALNTDLVINSSDFIKYLSLQTISDINFWKTYAITIPNDAQNWYRPGKIPFVVTNGVATASVITFTCNNNFSVGNTVIVSNLTDSTGASSTLNGTWTVATATSTQFTVTVSLFTPTSSYGNGSAYSTVITDLIAGQNALYSPAGTVNPPPAAVAFLNNGALIYDTTVGADLTNGTGEPTACITSIGNPGATKNFGIEFWVLGENLQNTVLAVWNQGSGSNTISVNPNGTVYLSNAPQSIGPSITDGFWHHIAWFFDNSTGYFYLYVDGQSIYSNFGGGPFSNGPFLQYIIGRDPSTFALTFTGYVDEIIVHNSNVTTTKVVNRFIAGSLLQRKGKSSADRIAEVLTLAGFGTITSGSIVVPDLYIGNSYQTLTAWTSGFVTGIITEPYYWNNPVTTSTPLDLILQITETDIGVFYQQFDGNFAFLDQNYFGIWAWNPSTNTGTWTLNPAISPSGNYVWTDDGTGVPYYGPSTQILRDDVDLWTSVQVNPQAGIPQIYTNTSAEPRYGYSTLVKSAPINSSLNAALSSANYLGYIYKSPLARVNSVELRAETENGATIPAMLGTNIYDVIQFKRSSPGASTAGSVNLNMAVESISNNFLANPGQWHTTFILDPYPVRP